MDYKNYTRYIKDLIVGNSLKKKNPKEKDKPAVTPGEWTTDPHKNPEWVLVGVLSPTGDSYHITWKNKEGKEITTLQSKVNFSYIAALNPVHMMEFIEEFDRLKAFEDSYKKEDP